MIKSDTYRKLPSASEEQTSFYVEKAMEFLASSGGLYSSYKSIAVYAIADYMASQDGLQLLRK